MDALRNVSISINEETGTNFRKTLFNKTETFETSKCNIDTKNCPVNSNKLQEELEQHNVSSVSNASSHKLLENELSGVEEKSIDEEPSISKCFKQKRLNVVVENASDLQPYQSSEDNIVGVASAFSPTSFLAYNKQNHNSCSYSKYVHNASSNVTCEKLYFDCNNSRIISLQKTDHQALPFYNLVDSFVNHYRMSCAFIKHENSREVVKNVLSSQIIDCKSSESKIAVGDLIGQLLKSQPCIDNNVFKEQKYCSQLSSNVQRVLAVGKECSKNSNLDLISKCSLNNNNTECVSLSTNDELLVYPEIDIAIKMMNQRNIVNIELLKECKEQVTKRIRENESSNSKPFLQFQQGTTPYNFDLPSTRNEVKDFMLFQDNVSIIIDEVKLHENFCHGRSFQLNHYLSSTKVNVGLGETNCTMNLFNQCRGTLSDKESAETSQALVKHNLLLLNNTVITKSRTTVTKENSLSSFSKDIEESKMLISFPQNEIDNKLPIGSDNTQLLQTTGTTDTNGISKSCENGNAFDKKLKFNLRAELKSTHGDTLTNLIKNRFPHGVSSLERLNADVIGDCTLLSCENSVEIKRLAQYPSLQRTVEKLFVAKLSFNNKNGLFREQDTFAEDSIVQSKVNENLYFSSKGKSNSRDNETLATEQKSFHTRSNTNLNLESDPWKQLGVQMCPPISCLSQPLKACLNEEKSDVIQKVELSDVSKYTNMRASSFSSLPELTSKIMTDSDQTALDKKIKFEGEPLKDQDFDAVIDKAIDESIIKYQNITCDIGVLATPHTSNKSSQTDTVSNERKLLCKRCLKFDGENETPSKRTKIYQKNIKASNFSNCLQNGTNSLTEPILHVAKCDFSSKIMIMKENGSTHKFNNLSDEVTRNNNNMLQTISNNISLSNQDIKGIVNMDTLYGDNGNASDEISFYDEDMDVEDEWNQFKDSKEMYESESILSDHKVPVTEREVARTTLIKSPFSFNNTPKKPILKVGLSRSARLKPLHQK